MLIEEILLLSHSAFLAISSIMKHINDITILFVLRFNTIYILIYIVYYFN